MTQLDLPMKGNPVAIDIDDVKRQPGWGPVLSYCATKAGKQDKAVAADIGMQEAVWSRCKSGQNAPSGEQLARLMESCGNLAPLYWLMLRLNLDPHSVRPLESSLERENRELRERMAALEAEREVERRTIRDLMTVPR